MNGSGDTARANNPFSAASVRPGAIPFQFAAAQSAATVLERLKKNGGRGQIVGPHGSGKSALAAALVDACRQSGQQAVVVALHDGQRRLPPAFGPASAWQAGTVLIVDGYEQLGFWSRFRLRRLCRRRKLALVVTAHTSVGFPDLFRTATSADLACRVVEDLLGERPIRITPAEIRRRFSRHGGDLRELLFDLYDLYESRQRGGGASTDGTAF